MQAHQAASRRRLLQCLAASPLFAGSALAGEGPAAGTKLPDPIMWAPLKTETLIKSPKEAINVFDFEPVYGAMQQVGAPTIRHLVSAMVRRA
jgi:hypothetical protein